MSWVWKRAAYALPGMALLVLGNFGCANEVAPQLPSLHLPGLAQNLAAQRFGDTVELRWKNPERSTDGVPLAGKRGRGPFTAEICRGVAALAASCVPVARLPVIPGEESSYRDTLVPPLSDGEARALRYRVRLVNGRGRGATGAEVNTVAGRAPAQVTGLRAEPVNGGGVVVQWKREPRSTNERIVLRVVRAGGRPVTLGIEGDEVDAGGAFDPGAKAGVEQRYNLFRSTTLTIGKENLAMNSAPAEAVVAADAQAAPPAPPAGLDAVVNTLGAPEIDLVWQASDEAGVAGYAVFRAEDGKDFARLTPEPVRGASYADTTVRAGVRYRYRVSALNARGVAGRAGNTVERIVPAQ